jgi:ABC-type Fe3+/spermidine/putrescine transport system ATPase subunit
MQSILAQTDVTAVLVTHDQEEALSLGHRLAVMDQGRIVQYATPDEVIHQPRTRFVAQFLALGHFIAGDIQDHCIATEIGSVPIDAHVRCTAKNRQVELLVRPEWVQLCPNGDGTPVQVERVSFRGTRRLYTLRLPSGTKVCGLFQQDIALRSGDQIRVQLHPTDLVTFPRDATPAASFS